MAVCGIVFLLVAPLLKNQHVQILIRSGKCVLSWRLLKGRTKAYQFSTETINCFSLYFDYRQGWDKDFRDYLKNLDKNKPVKLCGEHNLAHKEIG